MAAKGKRWLAAGAALLGVSILALCIAGVFRAVRRVSVQDRLDQYGQPVRLRLEEDFRRAGLAWPARQVTFVGIKDARRLEFYARNSPDEPWRYVKAWPILAASGQAGPKLREGDRQVPEGIYAAESLNPNSRFHLALRVGYPNKLDRAIAAGQGRENLGGDIMIHGSDVSAGCLAIGDLAAEEIFVVSALAGVEEVRILLTPTDLRWREPDMTSVPPWAGQIYARLKEALEQLPSARQGPEG
jgi:hypothetical protein